MGKVIAKNVVERKSGFLYYVDGKGNVCEAKWLEAAKRKRKKSLKNQQRKKLLKRKKVQLRLLQTTAPTKLEI